MQLIRFVAVLIIGLAALAWGAAQFVSRTTQAWFEKDINLRAQLAVKGARSALAVRWGEGGAGIRDVLTEITHDERILAAAACGVEFSLVASTPDYPAQFTCAEFRVFVTHPNGRPSSEWRIWGATRALPGGSVYVNAVPVLDGETPLGFVVLVHDLAFIERREARARQLILVAFGVLAVAACLATLIAARLFRRRWTADLRRLLQGDSQRWEFQPVLGDLREMIHRITAERRSDAETGMWTPQRLKETLVRHLHGERIVVLANREPYIHERDPNGGVRVMRPASGLVTALEPVMRACSGVWIAHGSGSADRATADAQGRLRVPPGEESYTLRRIWLTPEEEKGYYYGFANEGVWPLCHLAHTRPVFRNEDWKQYCIVNERFAEAVCSEIDLDDPIVLVQDYHFALAPAIIRRRLPRATIITFWHIPWPNAERLGICPWRAELLQGLLGSSIIGFQTRLHCNNFIEGIDRFLETRIDREQIAIVQHDRTTLVRDFPISIEWPSRWAQLPRPCLSAARPCWPSWDCRRTYSSAWVWIASITPREWRNAFGRWRSCWTGFRTRAAALCSSSWRLPVGC